MGAFEQTVNVLIKLIQLYLNDHVVHEQILLHNALSVLNHVACSVDGQEKLFIGRVGAIEVKEKLFFLGFWKNISVYI
jgi:hypothetical protein